MVKRKKKKIDSFQGNRECPTSKLVRGNKGCALWFLRGWTAARDQNHNGGLKKVYIYNNILYFKVQTLSKNVSLDWTKKCS